MQPNRVLNVGGILFWGAASIIIPYIPGPSLYPQLGIYGP